jgi:beta-lactamase regulating signal transducer with metallopeptidase domain
MTLDFANVLNGAARVAVAGLWQGLAIVFAVALCLQCARRMPAAQRFALWGAGFLAAAVLPLAPWLLSSISPNHAGVVAASMTPHPWFQLSTRWALAIAALWFIGSLARAVDLCVHVARLTHLWQTATPIDLQTGYIASRKFAICRTEHLEKPSVIGFFRPRVLIPDWLLPKLTREELDQIVLHESTHLTRRDDWTNLLQKLCLVFIPLNPALWWMDRQLAREREMACDEAVVRATRAPRAYAACLAGLAEHGMMHRREALSLGAWQHRSELAQRVRRILRTHRSLSNTTARVLLGAFGCGLVAVSVELVRCPQLVAFVPTAASVQSAPRLGNGSAQLGDAVFPNNPRREMLTSGAHVVEARAEMPTAPIAKPFAGRARTQAAAVGELRAASSGPGASKQPRPSMTNRQADSHELPQLIVFTSWEQIETVPAGTQTAVADYDTAKGVELDAGTKSKTAADDSKPADDAVQQKEAQHGMRFTQLILRVTPSNPSVPAAIPIGGGWLVIQL